MPRRRRPQAGIITDFKKALKDNGLQVPMATTNLFGEPVFKDGAFTSGNAKVRAYAIQKTMAAMDLAFEFGAHTYVFWGGREGAESDAGKDPVDGLKRFREALNFLCEYNMHMNYNYRFVRWRRSRTSRAGTFIWRPRGIVLGLLRRWIIRRWWG